MVVMKARPCGSIKTMKNPAKVGLAHIARATKAEDPQQKERLTSLCGVVNNPLATYATDDFIA